MCLQDYHSVEQEFTTLEIGLRGFQLVARLLPAEVANDNSDSHLPKLLQAIGV